MSKKREVDDAGLAAEINSGLGAPLGQFLQPAAATAGQNIGHRVTCQWLSAAIGHLLTLLPS
jgi:hypothetical protein